MVCDQKSVLERIELEEVIKTGDFNEFLTHPEFAFIRSGLKLFTSGALERKLVLIVVERANWRVIEWDYSGDDRDDADQEPLAGVARNTITIKHSVSGAEAESERLEISAKSLL